MKFVCSCSHSFGQVTRPLNFLTYITGLLVGCCEDVSYTCRKLGSSVWCTGSAEQFSLHFCCEQPRLPFGSCLLSGEQDAWPAMAFTIIFDPWGICAKLLPQITYFICSLITQAWVRQDRYLFNLIFIYSKVPSFWTYSSVSLEL